MAYIPYGKQLIDDDDIAAVVEVLRSDYLTQGPKIKEFEEALTEYTGANYAVVMNSGTAALHAAYFALGLSKTDEFITTPITFAATVNAGLYLGAKPIFVDIEPDTGNIDVKKVEAKISKKTKLISVVHYAGHSVDMEPLLEVAKKHNLKVVEDACHGLGGSYKDKKIGSCAYSDATVLSFHPVKQITTGEGGAVLTNDPEIYRLLLLFRSHGITKDPSQFINSSDGPWYHEMQLLGFNYRLTDIQAAFGISQLKKLDKFIKRRRNIVEIYQKEFANTTYFETPVERDYASHAYHLYPIKLSEKIVKRKETLVRKLEERGIGTQVHYIPVYRHPYYQKFSPQNKILGNAENFYKSELSLPLFFSLSKLEIKKVTDSVNEVFRNLS